MATEAKVRKVCEFLCQHPSHRRQHPKLCVSVRRRAKHSARPGVEGRINFKAGSSVGGGGGLPVVTYTGGSVRGGTSCGATPSGVDKSVMYGGGTFFLSPIFYTFLFFFFLACHPKSARNVSLCQKSVRQPHHQEWSGKKSNFPHPITLAVVRFSSVLPVDGSTQSEISHSRLIGLGYVAD